MYDKIIINVKIAIFKGVSSWGIYLLLWRMEFQKFRILKLCFIKLKVKHSLYRPGKAVGALGVWGFRIFYIIAHKIAKALCFIRDCI
jgi:hypothetical protein